MRIATICLMASLSAVSANCAQSWASFDSDQSIWTLSSGWIRAVFQLTGDGLFLTREITDLKTGDRWSASPNHPSSPVRLQVGAETYDAQRQYYLLNQWTQATTPAGIRQYIALQDLSGTATITVVFELYDN